MPTIDKKTLEGWFEDRSGKQGEACEFCLGMGIIDTDECVYPGEPHMAPVGTQKCLCRIDLEEYDNLKYQ